MKKVYMTLRETIPQAKPGSRDARPESLLDRLPANRSVKAMAVVAILSVTLWLTGCGDNQGENKPGNKDAQKPGDKIENPTGAQEKIFSNEVEISPENIEAGVETAGLSILKESLEYLIEEGPEDIKAMDGNESAFLQGAIDAQLITSNPNLHKAKPEDVNFEDFTIEGVDLSKPKVDIVYDKGNEGEFIEEDYLSVGIEPPEGGSKTIAASFLVDREKFEFFSNEEEIKKAIKYLENGKLEGLKPSYMIYQDLTSGRSGEAAEDMDDYQDIQKSKDKAELYLDSPQDPEKTAKKLNKIWSELPEVLEINPSKLSLVKKLPENTNASFEEKSSAGEDQYSSEQAPYDELEEATFTAEELDASLEAKEAAIYQQSVEIAETILTKLENSEKFYHSNEEAWGPYDSVVWSVKNYDNVEDKQDTLISVTRAVLDDPDSTEVLSLALSYPEEEEAFLVQFVVEDYDNDIPEITDQSEINKFKEFIKSKEIEESGVLKAGDIMWNSTKTGEEIRIIPSVDDFDGETTLNILSDIKDKAS